LEDVARVRLILYFQNRLRLGSFLCFGVVVVSKWYCCFYLNNGHAMFLNVSGIGYHEIPFILDYFPTILDYFHTILDYFPTLPGRLSTVHYL